jgi:hypothetical protein
MELVATGTKTVEAARKLRRHEKTVKDHVGRMARFFQIPEDRNYRICLAVMWHSELFRIGLR